MWWSLFDLPTDNCDIWRAWEKLDLFYMLGGENVLLLLQ